MRTGTRSASFAALSLLVLAAHGQQRVEDIREGTNTSVALSPDGQSIVTDLLGGLWRVPAAGGGAVTLVAPGHGARLPRFSPNGETLVYQRYVDGQWDLWLLDLASGTPAALTASAYNELQPDFMPGGHRIVFAANRAGRYGLWSIDLRNKALDQLNDEPGDSFFPTVSESGEIAYVRRERARWTLRLLDRGLQGTELLAGDAVLSAPSWRPGGGVIVYQARNGTRASRLEMLVLADEPVVRPLTEGEDLFESRPVWLSPAEYIYTADGQIWRRGIAGFDRRPVHLFAAMALDAPPAPTAMPVDDLGPFPVQGQLGASRAEGAEGVVAFSALGDIWLATEQGTERLTDDEFLDIDPSLSPDGSRIVFATDRGGRFDLWEIDTEDGTARPMTSTSTIHSYAPAISPDARFVAYLETDGLGPWAETNLELLDLGGNRETSRFGGTLYDASRPRWVSVGREPRLVVEARPDVPTAPRQRLSFDIGGNRMPPDELDEAAAAPPPAPELPEDARLQWTRDTGDDAYVIEAGRVFDGVRDTYRRHMDIHIEGREIVAIVGRGVRPSTGRTIDARDATVLPGLIDTHAHQSRLAGSRLGRAWLAYGVTTVRETGGDPAEGLARAESWASGAELGPRLLVASGNPAAAPPLLPPAQRIDAFAHELYWQAAALGFPSLPRGDLFAALGAESRPRVERVRVSPVLKTYQDTVALTQSSRRFLSTTLAAAVAAGPSPAADREPAYARLFDAEERSAWRGGAPDEALDALRGMLAELVRSGANVVIGSGAPAVPYGLGLHMELELLAESGIPNDQLLRLATAQGARALGLDARLGTLEAGKIADLVIVDGDPLTRITDTRTVRAVVLEGRWHDRRALLEPTRTPTP